MPLAAEAQDRPQRRAAQLTARWLPLLLSLLGLPLALVLVRRAWPDADLYIRSPDGSLEAYLGIDFVNFWTGARLALTGDVHALFDIAAYQVTLKSLFGPGFPYFNWSYPPHLLLLLWPLGLLPYLAALVAWTGTTLTAYLAAALPWRATDRRWPMLAALLLAPSTIVNISSGQNGFLTAALLVGGMRQLERNPVFAGVLFGCLTTKPHLGLVLPPILLALGAWRAIAAARSPPARSSGRSVLAYGVQAWQAFMAAPYQAALLTGMGGSYRNMMPTVYHSGVALGLGSTAALALQAAVGLAAVGVATWIVRRRRDPVLWTLAAASAGLLASPYALYYDLTALTAALALYLANRPLPTPGTTALAALAWSAAPLTLLLNLCGLPLAPCMIAGILAVGFCDATGRLPQSPNGTLRKVDAQMSQSGHWRSNPAGGI